VPDLPVVDIQNPPQTRRVFICQLSQNWSVRISRDSGNVCASYPIKSLLKQAIKKYITHLLGSHRVNAIYFNFFIALLLIDSFIGVYYPHSSNA
jgi:hypothetical protein